MSILDSTFPNGKNNTLSKKGPEFVLSLNDVLKESLKKAQAEVENMQLIVRCETLPQIEGDEDDMLELFDNLIAMILKHPPQASRLFLYVECEEIPGGRADRSLEKDGKQYIIKFHTNINTHNNWKLINSQALINCRQILSNHNGNLVVNDISSTGCLFSITLPGKIE